MAQHDRPNTVATATHVARRSFVIASCGALVLLSGCQAAVMVGRIFFGDPEVPSALESATDIRLEEEDSDVYVVCTAPSVMTTKYETLNVDLPDELMRRLRRRGVSTGDASDAVNATANFGGRLDVRDIGAELDPGYLIHIDFDRFSLTEDGSKTLFRGRAGGRVTVYELRKRTSESSDVESSVHEVFQRGFETTYPRSHPVPADQTPEKVFQKRFLSHVSDEMGRMLYRYRVSETL